ncbi:disintegrin and metalloproteinase domain-containing protein 11 [Pitangus sulphuratus]|nr:disintegrin and metalloproteinase domain-containing protein 11 [Pitangus sulphuratus]
MEEEGPGILVSGGSVKEQNQLVQQLKFWTAQVFVFLEASYPCVTESFLSKEVTYVVSSNKEAKRGRARTGDGKQSNPTSGDTNPTSSGPAASRGNPPRPHQKPPDTALLSRGKELLQKAMKKQDTCSGSSILANARLWGVQILHVDGEMLCPWIQNSQRQFRPFHHQFQSFPDLNFLAPKSCSPFEPLKSLSNSCQARAEGSDGGKSPRSTAAPRKRRGFCECCQETFEELQKHLQSPQHQRFARDDSQYLPVDRVISQLTNSSLQCSHRVPQSCLADEHLVPQAHGTGGVEMLTELGKEREQPEQGAVELLMDMEQDHDLAVKGCPAAQAGAVPRRVPRAGWQDGRVVSQITHPSRLVGQSSGGGEVAKHQLDTRVRNEPGGRGGGGEGPGLHLAQVSFVVHAFGSAFTLDLRLNHHLLASHYVERHLGSGGNGSHSTGAGEHCYYQGRIRGQPRSFAALSSCQGLRGVFSDGRATYLIEPQAGAEHGQVRRAQHTVHSETKYIELAVVNDHQLVSVGVPGAGRGGEGSGWPPPNPAWPSVSPQFLQLRKSVVLTSNFAKTVVNLADMIYKEQLNTRIVLVAMETWAAEDRIRIGQDSLETLNEFVKYRREGLVEHSDTVHLFSGRTFQSSRSGTAFVGGICSPTRAGGVNEYGNVATMAVTLAQTLGQNVGMMWNKHRTAAGDCRCPDSWLGCIMEDTGALAVPQAGQGVTVAPPHRYYLPRKFSRCSIDEYNQFLQDGGGSCLFNKPLKLLDPPECGNGFVEAGEECDCGSLAECARSGGNCCKKCTLTHDAMCSDGLCCKGCKYEPRGVSCREAVNECDIPESCTGDSSQCPPNLHKLDGYFCDNEQLVDGSDLSYVEDGTPCGPGMLCLDRKCLPATAFNFSSCPGSWDGKICFDHGVCSNEGKCICRAEWTGKDCSVYDPIPEPKPTGETERYKGPSGTNIIIGSIAGAVLVAAIVLGGTGWGFK